MQAEGLATHRCPRGVLGSPTGESQLYSPSKTKEPDRCVRLNTAHSTARTSFMKKTKRKTPTGKPAAPGRPGGPTKARLSSIASDVMAQERRDRRSLDRQAERAAKTKRKQP
jgi:hypothetical protein